MEDDEYVGVGRLKIYRAGDRASRLVGVPYLDGTEEATQAYVDRITRSAWWKREMPTGPKYIHVFARYGGSGSYAYGGTRQHPRFPKRSWQPWISMGIGTRTARGLPHARDQWVILHEVAHIVCNYAGHRNEGHGRVFAYYYLKLVRRWLGPEAAAALRLAYKAEGIKFSLPRKVGK